MKKFVALFLVFSLLVLSGNMFAKEKRGAEIEIYKTKQVINLKMEGTPWEKLNIEPNIRGELIAIKENSLILLERDSGADVSIDIADIKAIRIVRKSKALIGLLVGGAFGALLGRVTYTGGFIGSPGFSAGIGAAFGALLGTLTGASEGTDEKIQIEGKSNSEIKEVLEKLRKKARVTNFQ